MNSVIAPLCCTLFLLPFNCAAADDATSFQGKSVDDWIYLLRKGKDSRTQAEAAEALGYIARSSRMTEGGFSDLPYDVLEPPQLKKEVYAKIIAALEEGLQNPDATVCRASAVAVSWIGPRARQTIPLLIPLLTSEGRDVPEKAMLALGQMGPAAKQAIPHLKKILIDSDTKSQVDAASALRRIKANPEIYIPTLIALLADQDMDHSASIELSHLGDPAVPALLRAMKDNNDNRRMYAAYTMANLAGWKKLTRNQEEVVTALIVLTKDKNPDVVYKAIQALGSVEAVPEKSIPVLISFLDHKKPEIAREAAQSIGNFEAAGQPALNRLIDELRHPDSDDSWYYSNVAGSIRRIGLNRETAEKISQLDFRKIPDCSTLLLIPLCEYPDLALNFLKQNPAAVAIWPQDYEALRDILRNESPPYQGLRSWLYESDQLPLAIMAQTADSRFLPIIRSRMKNADAHTKTLMAACARACGAPSDRVVKISATRPGDFKPASAWPGSDPRRQSKEMRGHGDGSTEVIVTGRILGEDGQPVTQPHFYRTNDSWLLGQKKKEEVPLTYDEKTGRFVFVTDVFAAYDAGKNQPEPGPYQTGSSMVQIEARGCKPLKVQFYDEMPEVEITLPDAD
ncbi:putative lyase [Gimesia panareensis]|uniref:Putative lyase n=1 Tax=Gimesia panareensis TaxID=2527978 RepID=A0A517Q9U1_9PLAN|nr:HEAT repeat domain-containing protein [Gimesia panareensis]QDT28399.1 putative lyase [Gimesia panareensis]